MDVSKYGRQRTATLRVGESVMKVVYSDESGTGGSLKKNPIIVVTGLLLNLDHQWIPVRDDFESALKDIYGLSDSQLAHFAVKGHRLYQQIERGDERASNLMKRLMAIPYRRKVPIWYGAVDRDGYKYHMENIHIRSEFSEKDVIRPFRIAFEECLNRIDTYVHAFFHDEQILWIHDEGSLNTPAKNTLKDLRFLLKEAERDALYFAEIEPDPERRPEVLAQPPSHIADMIYFGDHEESRLLQLADVCCSTIARELRHEKVAAPYYEILRIQVQNAGTRPRHEDARKKVMPLRAMLERRRKERSSR